MMMHDIQTVYNSEKGNLSYLEVEKDVPFEIKRVFYTYAVKKNEIRGYHAHKEMKQLLFCPHGKISVLLDDGRKKQEYLLDKPSKALLLLPQYWHTMTWLEEGSVLCALASHHYDERDYLRNYTEFLEYWRGE